MHAMRGARRVWHVQSTAAASLGVAAVSFLAGCGEESAPPPPVEGVDEVYVEPSTLQFGRYSPCAPPTPLPVVIVNRGATPLPLLGFSTSCRCVGVTFGGHAEVPPGGTVEGLVSLSPWGQPGPHGHDLAIRVGDPASPQVLPVRIAYFMDPEVVLVEGRGARTSNPAGRLRFEAVDGVPFRVLGTEPRLPISIDPTAAPASAVELDLPWASLDALAAGQPAGGLSESEVAEVRDRFRRRDDGSWRAIWVTLRTDHPTCPEVTFGLADDRPLR